VVVDVLMYLAFGIVMIACLWFIDQMLKDDALQQACFRLRVMFVSCRSWRSAANRGLSPPWPCGT
jgi:hypothetical protein